MRIIVLAVAVGVAVSVASSPDGLWIAGAADGLTPGSRVWLHAHNCYPQQGLGQSRISRALGTGLPWIAIEQDLVWAADSTAPFGGRSVVAHETTLGGDEPTLEAHFFARVLPLLDRALAGRSTDGWPVLILHLDFKTNEPEHHRYVWDLLGRYQRYLTTATKGPGERRGQGLSPGPLLVLTEAGEGQESEFYSRLSPGETLRLFGSVPPPHLSDEQRALQHQIAPDTLIADVVSGYRRWVNLPWDAVERGGPDEAGAWTPDDDKRLRALVERAHRLGLWIRFYTLNGHPAIPELGWSASYNFGSLDAAQTRWRASFDAGVDLVATDQYEELAAELKRRPLEKGRTRP